MATKIRGVVPRMGKGSRIRPDGSGGYRSIVAVGGPTFQSVANAASGTLTFTLAEPAVLDKLIIGANAATALVASPAEGSISGSFVTGITLSGDSLVSGNVGATLFNWNSLASPRFGHTVLPGVNTLSITVLNESGATLEYNAAFSVA